ncbi:Hydroxyquinol 1 [Escovopsis weberi]|uniref:Hydroxyquinol 1 n=1 Tax=Escovopsis weberi TaxID=150374 RepID=A0A0M8MZB6_ESCWE|nr:Hydroxyquinol 1 [Escovopsis weberi]
MATSRGSFHGPPLLELTMENFTSNTIRMNTQGESRRARFLMERLITHVHDFIRETRLSTGEWRVILGFMSRCSRRSDQFRNELLLLSDILGISVLIDSIDHPKPPNCTEGNVMGPCFTLKSPEVPSGTKIGTDPQGQDMLVLCTVSDSAGRPLPGVKVDVWHTDSQGNYDMEYTDGMYTSERGVLTSDGEGKFWFKDIKPEGYTITEHGPVGDLLRKLKRHPWRPGHMHFMFQKQGYDKLVTNLYMKGDPFEGSDALMGVKESLIVNPVKIDKDTAKKYGVWDDFLILRYDFVLATVEEVEQLRDRNALDAMHRLGFGRVVLEDHLPVPDLD